LKDKRNIKFAGLFLLLLYLFGNSPALMFHHHDEIIAFEKATKCEKTVYYSDGSNSFCEHKAHLSKVLKKCFLCDNHCVSVHLFTAIQFVCINVEHRSEYTLYKANFYEATLPETQNRGPPII